MISIYKVLTIIGNTLKMVRADMKFEFNTKNISYLNQKFDFFFQKRIVTASCINFILT